MQKKEYVCVCVCARVHAWTDVCCVENVGDCVCVWTDVC